MTFDRVGKAFRIQRDRYGDRVSAEVAKLGWTAERGDDVDAVYHGRDGQGREFLVRAVFGDDPANDFLEWRGGPLRLDELLVAVTNGTARDRSWLAHVNLPEGIGSAAPDQVALREALNARAAEGASPRELNDYALQLGAGGATGVLMRFGESAVEVEPAIAGLHVLAASHSVAASVLTDAVRSRLPALAQRASGLVDGPTFQAFVGRPLSLVRIETRESAVEVAQQVAELGSELRARIESSQHTLSS